LCTYERAFRRLRDSGPVSDKRCRRFRAASDTCACTDAFFDGNARRLDSRSVPDSCQSADLAVDDARRPIYTSCDRLAHGCVKSSDFESGQYGLRARFVLQTLRTSDSNERRLVSRSSPPSRHDHRSTWRNAHDRAARRREWCRSIRRLAQCQRHNRTLSGAIRASRHEGPAGTIFGSEQLQTGPATTGPVVLRVSVLR